MHYLVKIDYSGELVKFPWKWIFHEKRKISWKTVHLAKNGKSREKWEILRKTENLAKNENFREKVKISQNTAKHRKSLEKSKIIQKTEKSGQDNAIHSLMALTE